MPSSPCNGVSPRFSAPITLVVMPDECQSIPITAPNDWNQNGWGKTPQQLVAPVMMDDSLADHRAQAGHSIREPFWDTSAVQRKIGSPSSSSHQSSCLPASRSHHPSLYDDNKWGKPINVAASPGTRQNFQGCGRLPLRAAGLDQAASPPRVKPVG